MKFRHVCFIVADIKEAVKFYKKNFGFKVKTQETLSGEYPEKLLNMHNINLKYVKLEDKDGFTLELIESNKCLGTHISFTVDNIEKTYNQLKKRGVKFLSPPIYAPDSPVKVCHCVDKDENSIELVEPLQGMYGNH